jgi:hypothetical protein
VSRDTTLPRLAALRRRDEEQALARAVLQEELCRQAKAQSDAAADAAARHRVAARASERALVGSLAGRAVPPAAIVRAQMELDRLALETARLRAAAATAQARFLNQCDARAKARENLHQRQRAAAKLDFVLKREIARRSRRDAALAETEADERNRANADRRSP